MYCKDCGMTIPDGARFCRGCGASQDHAAGAGAGTGTGAGTGAGSGQPPETTPSGQRPYEAAPQPVQQQPFQPPPQGQRPYEAAPQPGQQQPFQAPPQGQRPYVAAPPPGQQQPFQAPPQGQRPFEAAPPPGQQQQYQAPPPGQQSPVGHGTQLVPRPDGRIAQQAPPPHAMATQPGQGQQEKKKRSAAVVALLVAAPIVILASIGFGIYFFMFRNASDGPSWFSSDPTTTASAAQETTTARETTTAPETTTARETTAPQDEATTEEAAIGQETAGARDDFETTYTYLDAMPEPKVEFETIDGLFPSLYRMQDYIATFMGSCEYGETNVMVEVEVPGFTQPYRQMVTLDRQLTKIRIVPPLLTGDLNLRSEKNAQLTYSVTDLDTGRILVHDSKNILIYSKFDMIWWTPESKDMNIDNILAWMTPEAPGVLELKRNAIDYLEYISDGGLNAIVGYQDYGFFDNVYWNTWVQAVAVQGAMSDIHRVRYNNSSFSIDKDVHQRVLAPDDVLSSQSGLCIETALVMASALQSAGMHTMLIFPPGHAQVAVEAWPNTGDYFLIETTALPMEQDGEVWDKVVSYMDKEEWLSYITGYGYNSLGECYVLDCDLGKTLDILPMSN